VKKFRYGKQYFLLGIISILFTCWVIFLVNEILNKLILICVIIYGMFGLAKDTKSYFTISDEKLIWHKRNREYEIYWNDVQYISTPHSIGRIISQVCIHSDECKSLLITWWISNYRELIELTFEKCKNNDGIVIDDKVLRLVKSKVNIQ